MDRGRRFCVKCAAMGDPFTLVAIGVGVVLAAAGVWYFTSIRKQTKHHEEVWQKTQKLGLHEPVSLHPKIDLDKCICTGACVTVCPEKDVIGWIDNKPKLIKPSACIGHGECLRNCPVEAITLVIGSEKRGVDLPLVDSEFQSNVKGLHIVGELGGMGLIHNAVNQGQQAVRAIAKVGPPKVAGVHQVLIVGAGPAGLGAALACKESGLDFCILEQEKLGGAIFSYPRQKIVMTAPANLPGYGKVKLSRTTKESLLELYGEVVKKIGITIEEGVKVNDIKKDGEGIFNVDTTAGARKAQRVVLAIGRRGTPRKLGVPGETHEKVTYKLLEPEQYRGKKCMVFGGGDSAVEGAMALAREEGTTVTLVHRGDKFDRCKPANREALEKMQADKKLDVRMNGAAVEVTADAVKIKQKDSETSVPNDYVFVLIGGELPTAWLSKIGVNVTTMRGEAFPAANA